MVMIASVARAATLTPPLETIGCYICGSPECRPFLTAQDDLTGKPGTFHFVRCTRCGLAYQNPRVSLEHIAEYYDEDYIAHRRRRNWGVLTPLFERAMHKLDVDKHRLVSRYATLGPGKRVLDAGCAVGTFLQRLRRECGVLATGVDFKDLSAAPSLEGVEFHCSLFYDAPLPSASFDLVTMWHFLEHDYDPMRSLRTARRVMKEDGRLVIEVPRLDSRTFRWFGHRWPGLQAPQHTVLFTRDSLVAAVRQAGLEVVDYLPYGAFPAYFYVFTGAAFALLKGRGLNLERAIVPYFLGQAMALPLLAFEKHLNLAMQTIVCRRAS
jgi:SAM-dependent methyltransferase